MSSVKQPSSCKDNRGKDLMLVESPAYCLSTGSTLITSDRYIGKHSLTEKAPTETAGLLPRP